MEFENCCLVESAGEKERENTSVNEGRLRLCGHSCLP